MKDGGVQHKASLTGDLCVSGRLEKKELSPSIIKGS